jgi:hypothetical protein
VCIIDDLPASLASKVLDSSSTFPCADNKNVSKEMKIVRKYGPQNDHVERCALAKRFFIARWERERAERAKRERSRKGRGLNTPQWDSA